MSAESAKGWLAGLGLEEAPAMAIVAGSGWRSVTERLRRIASIPIRDIPGCRPPAVEGHGAELALCANARGSEVLVATGRVHLYEGCGPDNIVALVRRLGEAGVERLILTNAVGGLDPKLRRGDIVAVEDDINLTWRRPALCKNLGDGVYDRELLEAIEAVAHKRYIGLSRGTYGAVCGPNFETCAEIAMLRRLGATVVGMSTALEARAARCAGMRVAALSLVTNCCSTRPSGELAHEEVLETARDRSEILSRFLAALIDHLH